MSTAAPTDGTALAVAIAVFETEFPTLEWHVSKKGKARVWQGSNLIAIELGNGPAHGLELATTYLRKRVGFRAALAALDAALTAEYGPDVVSCK